MTIGAPTNRQMLVAPRTNNALDTFPHQTGGARPNRPGIGLGYPSGDRSRTGRRPGQLRCCPVRKCSGLRWPRHNSSQLTAKLLAGCCASARHTLGYVCTRESKFNLAGDGSVPAGCQPIGAATTAAQQKPSGPADKASYRASNPMPTVTPTCATPARYRAASARTAKHESPAARLPFRSPCLGHIFVVRARQNFLRGCAARRAGCVAEPHRHSKTKTQIRRNTDLGAQVTPSIAKYYAGAKRRYGRCRDCADDRKSASGRAAVRLSRR